MAAEHYFATGFNEARRLFHNACRNARRRPAMIGKTHGMFGGLGGALVEVVRLGDLGARNLLVLCAGSRLADALCCAGIEVGWLSEFADAGLPPRTALVLVNTGATPAAGGEQLPEEREIPKWDSKLLAKVEERYAEYARERGIDHQGAPLEPGSPGIVDVPGFAPAVLDGIAAELASAREGRLVFLEIAVGLGPYGQAEITPCHAPDSTAAQRARSWFGLPAPGEGQQGTVQRPDHLTGGLMRRFPGAETTTLHVAFGTYSVKSVLDMLSADKTTAPAPDVRRLLFPESAEWHSAVWQNAAMVIQRALAAIGQG